MNNKKKTAKTATKESSAIARTVSAKDIGLESKEVLNPKAMAQNVRVLVQNRRQGTVGVKGRSDVSFSNKKPWKQKGTGRARAGSARSPLWRKGGVIFGPQPRVRTLSVPKKMRQKSLATLLWSQLENDKIICLGQGLATETPKTKMAYDILKQANLLNHRVNLFVPHEDVALQKSFANIPTVRMYYFDEPNIYDLASAQYWVFFEKDFDAFKTMVTQWS